MPSTQRTIDRRRGARFDIVGGLTGTLAITHTYGVGNISRGGALLTAVRPLDLGTNHVLQLEYGTCIARSQARVARISRTAHDESLAVAFTFLDADLAALDSVGMMVKIRERDVSDGMPASGGCVPADTSPDVAETRERRRQPRAVMTDATAAVSSLLAIELLDVSPCGALMRCRCPLRVHDRAQIRALFRGEPLIGWATVERVSPESSGAVLAGIAFTSLDDGSETYLRAVLAT
jgi:hypothetical protein